ncbi:riboflavin biosynthesis protein RibD [Candidatus Desantisbacteria bacterium CG2_30_40_21]|uniref:Riboflavin biosynthesis protein RibD n=5 Tax=unclassified Candidatus Desantisiibacteriota TaxID=3106372 RepID=A0A2M7JBP9_9BACT|nr:MAG: riboflavin biosynthesis protein RibD [Candidatus Desantisbacteria bacterium CG2_30_40_21]PIP40712.1 MAG: riboflavin biosynthesis protein RibD [Candidatus Desantisbacteria bacterium CG23_combo_of_CG06-09_8_20_14_all_40_23]PIX16804.1 MAG: riboflavin biosynthesis protein RibD [Candidatus Desantisbacteria bacterium CG_4_8_14_3_um_filter_40_12]PIY19785.1 MAG: riboflavin biosynthesis protein RibD [Candidatus Desantisbacteria bacterium CG_4_10_14_3_um_filter_40_18]PJB28756.1 MAG: riboflavin bi
MFSSQDKKYMAKALSLASRARGKTSPNPMVGCVIVKHNQIVGQGFHCAAGLPHAEINALNEAGDDAHDATMFVTLEPCCHYGKTPPCVDEIIKAKIKKVIISIQDPNPVVSGKGLKKLQEAGIIVESGLLQDRASKLNEVYIKYITTQMPFVLIKAGMSMDGKIQNIDGKIQDKWITGEKSRYLVHKMRGMYDAIMVGKQTVLDDNPYLTCRLKGGRDPYRVIVDSTMEIPMESNVFASPQMAIIATTINASQERIDAFKKLGVRVIITQPDKDGRVDIPELMKQLGKLEITSVLIEGGAHINASALSSGVVDKMALFISSQIFGKRDYLSVVEGLDTPIRLKDICVKRVGEDVLIEGFV